MRLLITIIGFLAIVLSACSDSTPTVETTLTPTASVVAISIATGTLSPIIRPTPTQTPTQTPLPTETQTPTETPSPTETQTPTIPSPVLFDGKSAYEILLVQMGFGPRWPGSPGHASVGDYIVDELGRQGWEVEEQGFDYMGLVGRNIIGRNNVGAGPVIIIGAHYDTRKIADKTAGSTEPVPGAVDGASGVAVLLELARTLDFDEIDHDIWLAFFDVEDQGSDGMPGFSYIVGSTYMAETLEVMPRAMVLVDMIGDADQQLFYEGNSDLMLSFNLWRIAYELGYGDTFIPEHRHTMLDDHLPFVNNGIPAVDIIDFDYPYWHTVEDTADKASPDSLERVGRTLEEWLENRLSN
ncbi:MAG: M28 family peptidase [Candidatus Promineifilaceae bacterium]